MTQMSPPANGSVPAKFVFSSRAGLLLTHVMDVKITLEIRYFACTPLLKYARSKILYIT